MEKSRYWLSILKKREQIHNADDCQGCVNAYRKEIKWIDGIYIDISKFVYNSNPTMQKCIIRLEQWKNTLIEADNLTVELQADFVLHKTTPMASRRILRDLEGLYNESLNRHKAIQELSKVTEWNQVVNQAREILSEGQARIEVEKTLKSHSSASDMESLREKYTTPTEKKNYQKNQRHK